MHDTQCIFDINTAGDPFNASLFDPPNPAVPFVATPSLPTAPTPPTPLAAPTLLTTISNFFRPHSPLTEPIPLKSNTSFGDHMVIPAVPNTTRLYFINLNGLNLQKKSVKFRDLCEELRKSDIDLFAAAEHNLDTNKFAVRQSLQDIARRSFTHHCIQTATSGILAEKYYKPGGTLLLAQGDLVGRIKDRGSDPLGRWSWMKLVGRNSYQPTRCVFDQLIARAQLPSINKKVCFISAASRKQSPANTSNKIYRNSFDYASHATSQSFW